jgi:hypothetical protein
MSRVLSMLDDLLSADPRDLVDGQLADALVEFEQAARKIDAARARVLAEFDARAAYAADGCPSAAAWLRVKTGASNGQAAADVRLARGLRELPATAAALADGQINAAHAGGIVGLRKEVPLEYVLATEAEFVTVAQHLDAGQLHRYLDNIRHAYQPDQVVDRENEQRTRRELSIASTLDGMVYLRGVAHPEAGAIVHAALSALAGKTGTGDLRSKGQRRWDALETLCRAFLDSGQLPATGGAKSHVVLVADLPTLLGAPGARMADLGYAGQISGEAARRIACDAAVSRIITDGPSCILDAGRTTRTVTPAINRALRVRDGGCVMPGCGAHPDRCQAHHLIHWARGGETTLDLMGLLCAYHHWLVHEGGWTLTRNQDGSWTATPP